MIYENRKPIKFFQNTVLQKLKFLIDIMPVVAFSPIVNILDTSTFSDTN